MKFKITKVDQIDEVQEMDEREGEYIPLLNVEDEDRLSKVVIPDSVSVLPLRNNVLFPGLVLPITVGRNKSIQLVRDSQKGNKYIGVFTQKDKNSDDPEEKDLYKVGTLATVMKTLQMPDGSITLIIQGKRRIKIRNMVQTEPYMKAEVEAFDDVETVKKGSRVFNAMIDTVKEMFKQMSALSTSFLPETEFAMTNIDSPKVLLYFITSLLEITPQEKQKVLENKRVSDRATLILNYMNGELQMLELKNHIQSKVRSDMDKQQKEYILNQQLKTIQEELGGNPAEADITELKEKAEKKKWREEVQEVFDKEIVKLSRTHTMSPEYSVQLNYLNVLVDLPWESYTTDRFDLKRASKILDEDHFGLEKVKERILSYIAVLKLKGDMKAPIMCLYGPPGVGKTSLGKSIARAMGRKYVRMSLGGLRDEAEIRGHRRTYVGAVSGRILKNITKAHSSNPVFVLDEIDKVSGMNFNGDPSSALLEVLDPEQNTTFHDNFLEVDYDLSRVLFVATANQISDMHPALLDRMELIEVPGYVVEEKCQIARKHLIPRQLKEHGLKGHDISFSVQVLEYIISFYTRESGVRQLEKRIADIIRYRAREIVELGDIAEGKQKKEGTRKFAIDKEYVKKVLGLETAGHDARLKHNTVGVVAGLSWSSTGGDILFIETSLSKGKGNMHITGNLGDVMKESATLAYEYIKSHAGELGIKWSKIEESDVYVHVPEGAIPKDGPSGGIALYTSMLSAFTGRKVKADLAMTGEITLRGQVLPIGGVREKILAAKRADIHELILCKENMAHVDEIPEEYKKGLNFNYVEKVEEVGAIALEVK